MHSAYGIAKPAPIIEEVRPEVIDILYAAQHPQMSEALLMEGNNQQSFRFIANMAAMHILKE